MATIFHILDAISQDVEGDAPVPGNLSDDDPEVRRAKPKKPAADDAPKNPSKMTMNIYLFGKTAAGEPLRVSVEGFKPFFYIKIPSVKAITDFKKVLDDRLRKSRPWLRSLVEVSLDRKSTRLNSSHCLVSRMPSSA